MYNRSLKVPALELGVIMRKYASDTSTFELCFKPTERSKVRRTGRLENDLTNISMFTREMADSLLKKKFIVFFINHDGEETAIRPVHFLLPTPEHNQHIEVKSKPKEGKHKRRLKKEPELMKVYHVLMDNGKRITHESYDVCLRIREALLNKRKMGCAIIPSTVVRPPNYQYKIYKPFETVKEKESSPFISSAGSVERVSPPTSAVSPVIKREWLVDLLPKPLKSFIVSVGERNGVVRFDNLFVGDWENEVEKYLVGQGYLVHGWETEENVRYLTIFKGQTRRLGYCL